jgi:hypothetical protein
VATGFHWRGADSDPDTDADPGRSRASAVLRHCRPGCPNGAWDAVVRSPERALSASPGQRPGYRVTPSLTAPCKGAVPRSGACPNDPWGGSRTRRQGRKARTDRGHRVPLTRYRFRPRPRGERVGPAGDHAQVTVAKGPDAPTGQRNEAQGCGAHAATLGLGVHPSTATPTGLWRQGTAGARIRRQGRRARTDCGHRVPLTRYRFRPRPRPRGERVGPAGDHAQVPVPKGQDAPTGQRNEAQGCGVHAATLGSDVHPSSPTPTGLWSQTTAGGGFRNPVWLGLTGGRWRILRPPSGRMGS